MFTVRTALTRTLASAATAATATSARAAARAVARPALAMPAVTLLTGRRFYHEKALIDHYTRPRNVGSLDRKDPSVGSGLVGAPACGDVMKLDIRVDPISNKIVEAKFKTFGCGSAIASSSYLTTLVKGKTLEDAVAIKNIDIASELCLPPVKLHCSMLAEDAIKAAVADYRSKRPETNLGGTSKTIAQAAVPHQAQAAAAAI